MKDFAFKVYLVAVVRVRADDESVARNVVPTVLGAPGAVEIGLANENNAASWSENYHLFVLGAVAFGCAWFGRSALQLRWREWVRLHISGMSLSYVVMLIAFYVDNGKQLPIWKDLPHSTYWLVPPVVAAPLIVWALLWHPMVLRMKRAEHS